MTIGFLYRVSINLSQQWSGSSKTRKSLQLSEFKKRQPPSSDCETVSQTKLQPLLKTDLSAPRDISNA
ncbi:hypothetical protein VTH06DRAFT_4883 [Thermothelomyces fergusii]